MADHETAQAIQCWNFCENGMGGCDWPSLPLACELYDVGDIEATIARMLVIKTHRPDTGDDDAAKE